MNHDLFKILRLLDSSYTVLYASVNLILTFHISHPLMSSIPSWQWCGGKFGTVGTLKSPLPLLSPLFLSLPFSPQTAPPLPYLVAIIFLRINLPQTLHFFASLLGGKLLYHRSPLS